MELSNAAQDAPWHAWEIAKRAAAFTLCVILAACSTQPPAPSPIASTQGAMLIRTAQIMNLRDVTTAGGRSPGIGTLIGGVLGGLAGNSIGSGYGRAIATAGGGVAGSMAGHRVEQAGSVTKRTEVTVRFADGEVQTYNVRPDEPFRIGDTVKVITGGKEGVRIVPERL